MITIFAEERRRKILDQLKEKNKVSVEGLCEMFKVSQVTIRKDLQILEDAKKLTRTHGGALPRTKASFESTFAEKEIVNKYEKQRIAAAAANFVESGDTIALDSGSTTLELAKAIAGMKDITIITNDLRIISYLEDFSEAFIVCVGGRLRRGRNCLTGPIATENLMRFTVDKCFLGSESFSVAKGFTTPNMEQCEWKKKLIQSASQTFILMDSSKIGNDSFVNFAHLKDIDCLITDDGIDRDDQKKIVKASPNLELLISGEN